MNKNDNKWCDFHRRMKMSDRKKKNKKKDTYKE